MKSLKIKVKKKSSHEKKNPVRRWNQEARDDTKAEILEFNGKTQGDELLE